MSNAKQRRQAARDKKSATAGTKDGFANLTARMGMGAQNVLSDGMYMFNLLTKNRMQLEAMYRGSWVVGQVVDAVAEDMTRAGVTIKGEDDPENIQQMIASMTKLGIWGALLETIKWGRLYGGALAVMIVDGQKLDTPLDISTVGKDQFRGLKVYDRWQLQPELNNMIEDGMDAGLPAYYSVVSDINTGKVGNVRIHHSRVIRQIGIQLPAYQAIVEQFWGESVIERLHDRLVSFDTATSGAANLIQRAYLRTVKIEKLREVLAAGGKAEENLLTMFHHMRMLQTNEGLTLLDKEDEFAAHSYTFSGLSDMVLQFGQQLSGASGIPLVRLFGQSPAGLNSTGENDLRMYYDNIKAQQESRLREGVMRILRVLHQSKFEKPAPDNFDFEFVSLWQTSQKEKGDIAKSVVETVAKAHDSGIIDTPTAMKELKQASEYTGVFSNISEEQITEAENEPPPAPVETAPLPGEEGGDPIGGDPNAKAEAKPSIMDRLKAWING